MKRLIKPNMNIKKLKRSNHKHNQTVLINKIINQIAYILSLRILAALVVVIGVYSGLCLFELISGYELEINNLKTELEEQKKIKGAENVSGSDFDSNPNIFSFLYKNTTNLLLMTAMGWFLGPVNLGALALKQIIGDPYGWLKYLPSLPKFPNLKGDNKTGPSSEGTQSPVNIRPTEQNSPQPDEQEYNGGVSGVLNAIKNITDNF